LYAPWRFRRLDFAVLVKYKFSQNVISAILARLTPDGMSFSRALFFRPISFRHIGSLSADGNHGLRGQPRG
jgi:hypothetical protein